MKKTVIVTTVRSMRLLVRSSRSSTSTRPIFSVLKVFLLSEVSTLPFKRENSSPFLEPLVVVRLLF